MKKRTFTMMTAAILLTALCTAGSIPISAEEALILTRDTDGTVTIRVEEQVPAAAPEPSEWAYTYGSLSVREGENGQVIYRNVISDFLVYVVTDSEGLSDQYTPRDGIYPYSYPPNTTIPELYWNPEPPYSTQLNGTEVFPGDENFPEDGEQLLRSHGDGARLYCIEWQKTKLSPTVEYVLCMDDPHVLDVYDSLVSTDSVAVWDGSFILHTPILEEWIDPDTGKFVDGFTERDALLYYFDEELIDRLDHFTREEHPTWLAAYSAWRDTVDYANMTPEEREASLAAAGIMNDWEITKKAIDLAEEFETAYQKRVGSDEYNGQIVDLRFSMRPEEDITQAYHSEGIWETFGDCNNDAVVNSADAAEILSIAAKNGSSDTPSMANFYQSGDFNLDGYVNASDAADLLIYLADQGAGGSQSIREYVKSLQVSAS